MDWLRRPSVVCGTPSTEFAGFLYILVMCNKCRAQLAAVSGVGAIGPRGRSAVLCRVLARRKPGSRTCAAKALDAHSGLSPRARTLSILGDCGRETASKPGSTWRCQSPREAIDLRQTSRRRARLERSRLLASIARRPLIGQDSTCTGGQCLSKIRMQSRAIADPPQTRART